LIKKKKPICHYPTQLTLSQSQRVRGKNKITHTIAEAEDRAKIKPKSITYLLMSK